MVFNSKNSKVSLKLGNKELMRVNKFKHLGSVITDNAHVDKDIISRVQIGWLKWKEASRILRAKCIPVRVKEKFYKSVIGPAMLYGWKCSRLNQVQVKKLQINEIHMLRIAVGATILDRIKNDYIRGNLEILDIAKKKTKRKNCDGLIPFEERGGTYNEKG